MVVLFFTQVYSLYSVRVELLEWILKLTSQSCTKSIDSAPITLVEGSSIDVDTIQPLKIKSA